MKIFLSIILVSIATVVSSQNINGRNLPAINLETVASNSFEQGKVSVKFNRIAFNKINFTTNNNQILFNSSSLNLISVSYSFNKIKSLFATVLQNETKIDLHKKYNLDLWFCIEFDTTKNVKQLIGDLQNTNLFEVVEPVYKKHLLDANNSATFLPNDTRLNEQWHYNNTGQGSGKIGKDIKLLDAWDIETGKPQVIVSLHDMGVQLNHPDLAQNILPNKSFNFIDNNNTIIPGYHGTYTGGTIAAVNNNGIGVSGIAGGNGSVNSGARLMSCQIFDIRNGGFVSNGSAESYIYAADNGACISSNSWAYDVAGLYELNVMDAIDYFIETAGGSVLQGGLVIFAAGNISKPLKYFPSSYDRVICVAATNNRDEKTYYSTYGSWVDIAAPGGEDRNGAAGQILSTTSNGGYAMDQGTSAACPQVAGVAALVASKLAGKASASDVRDIILSTTDNIDSLNPNFINLIGTGRLNAYRALQKAQAILNNNTVATVDSFKAKYNCNSIDLSWKNNSKNVVIVYSNINDIGVAINGIQYSIGNSFSNNAKVIYVGNASNLSIVNNDSMLHYFKIFSVDASNNYSLGRTAEIIAPAYINASGSAEQNFDFLPLFPTQQWRTINPDNDISWIHTAQDTAHTGINDNYSMCMYNYNLNTLLGAVDILTSPLINVQNTDSIKLNFWYAYQYRNTGLPIADSFEVLISIDCGNSFTSLWKDGGQTLATSASLADSAFYPFSASKWKNISLDVSSYKNNKNLQFAFKATNGKGNNLFLDNINIDVLYKNDIAVTKFISLINTTCDKEIKPVVILMNKGFSNITSCKINYSIDGGNIVSTNWNGNLNKNDSVVVTLNSSTVSAGNHAIKIFSILLNNVTDNYNLNDTISISFYIDTYVKNPISEGFEVNELLPKDWTTQQNIADEITWVTTNIAGKNSNKSIVMKNYVYRDRNKIDDLITPAFFCSKNYDSAFLTFDYAYALRRLTDSTFFDTLQIDYTKDCGATWKTLWKKTGKNLTTFNQIANEVYEFFPEQNQWKSDSMLLSTNFRVGDVIQIRFRNINLWGNDMYLDNINVFAKFYPQGIQEKGYAIYPNPAKNIINIQHLNTPTTLKTIELINSIGRKVKTMQVNGNADKDIQLSLYGLASDVYFLRMIYTDKTVVEKIVKMPQ